jgi:hypothetical protein
LYGGNERKLKITNEAIPPSNVHRFAEMIVVALASCGFKLADSNTESF